MTRENLIKYRNGTALEWSEANPILNNGEAGFESDTLKFKIGDGVTPWNSLVYFRVDAGNINVPIFWDIFGDPEFYYSAENIESFKNYSLDVDLIEEYYNKGEVYYEIDLENGQNNNGDFLLEITLEDAINELYIFPNDIQVYFYDEKLNNTNIQGSFSFQKVENVNKILISLNQNLQGNFSFQINIEHPIIQTERRIFKFNELKKYYYNMRLIPPIVNTPKRLSQEYINYLTQWLEQYWTIYESEDPDLDSLPAFQYPNNNDLSFDPFDHAKSAINKDLTNE